MAQRIAVIAGDGIGAEVIPAGHRILGAVSGMRPALDLRYESFP